MFTGIITATTKVTDTTTTDDGSRLALGKPKDWDDLILGESVSVNGVCLTVDMLHDKAFECFMTPETLARSSFGKRMPKMVNLERSLSVRDRFGGHFVQGHVDEVGILVDIDTSEGYRLTIQFSPEFGELVVYKGSVTVDGVSLTIAQATDTSMQVAIIPHTLEHTTIGDVRIGDPVNLEFDILGKYVISSQKAMYYDATRSASR